MKLRLGSVLPILILTSHAHGETIREHPAPGTSIVRFAQLDEGVYKGSKPRTDTDFAFLQSKGIKYILNLKFLPFHSGREKRKAKSYGMVYLSVFINASPFSPSEKHVNRALEILHDPCYQPIYFHCDIGRDRTSLIATMYRIDFLELSRSEAWQQMRDYGFKDSWTLRGLKEYLLKHSMPPAASSFPQRACTSDGGHEPAHRAGERL